MAHLMKLSHEDHDEFWLDLDHVVSVALGTAMVQQGPSMVQMRGTIVVLSSGQKLLFGLHSYNTILKAKLDTEAGPPKDLDIPAAFLEGWKDPKEDLDKS